jgi:hypothetical protein
MVITMELCDCLNSSFIVNKGANSSAFPQLSQVMQKMCIDAYKISTLIPLAGPPRRRSGRFCGNGNMIDNPRFTSVWSVHLRRLDLTLGFYC